MQLIKTSSEEEPLATGLAIGKKRSNNREYSMSPKRILIFIFAVSIVLIVFLFSLFLAFLPQSPPQQIVPTPTVTAPSIDELNPETNPPVKYSEKQTDKLLQKVAQKTPLSETNLAVKKSIINNMNPNAETVFVTPQFRIEYIKTPDVFMVDILDTNVTTAKKAAVDWFLQKGLSPAAICTMPVTFYLSPAAAAALRGKPTVFSPLADGC